jgi:hypothetical protein
MKFFKLDLLTLLISLFILNSCKTQDTIGLGATGTNQVSGTLIDTSTIIVNTVPEDSVVMGSLPNSPLFKTPLGYFKDPTFGTTESNAVMDLNLPAESPYTLPTGTVYIDSAILSLRYAPTFYGDSIASRYKVNVYQLSERVLQNSVYFDTKKWKYNSGTLLGTKSFLSRTNANVNIRDIVSGGPDTITSVPPQLRIPIDTNFIRSILFNANPQQLQSNLVFKNQVNGFYVTMDKNQTGAGGTFMMQLSDTTASVIVYYRNYDGTTLDTSTVVLPTELHSGEIKHTYPAAILTELNNTQTSRNVIYLQGTAGLRTKISFPYLKNIVKNVGDVVLNRAELVITPTPGSTIPFGAIPRITMYQYDIAHQRIPLPDAQGLAVATFGGTYSTITHDYHFVITTYIQDLMRGLTVDNGTFIGAVDNADASSGIIDIGATPQVGSRTIAVGTDKTSPYAIKLNIIYTKISK